MPSKQSHRGKHPQDGRLFDKKQIPVLLEAVADLSYLLTRGYTEKASLKLVGDRYKLAVRQRRAVLGAACSDEALARRKEHWVSNEQLAGRIIELDGYNILITAESALSGGLLLKGRDGCIRDLASVHGSYRKVEETASAVELIGATLAAFAPAYVRWFLDAPVSNSGRLRSLLLERAEERSWPWEVELGNQVDKRLSASRDVVATSDGWILDRAQAWANLNGAIVSNLGGGPSLIDLSTDTASRVEPSIA
jgi:hypothetical protein